MKINTFTIIIGLVLLLACKTDRFDINITDVEVDIRIERFENDLFAVEFEKIPEYVEVLKEKYGIFFEDFNILINIGSSGSKAYPDLLKGFLTDYTINQIYEKSAEIYQDLTDLNQDLTDAFRHYKYYFPDKDIPAVYTYISGFNAPIIVDSNILGIGLDGFLGTDCEFYQKMSIPKYMRFNKHRDKIVPECMRAWALTEFVFNDSLDNLVGNMIYHGKLSYFLRAMLPEKPDSLIMGYSSDQIEWCKKYEDRMWGYLVENKLLFTSHYLTISKFINEGPFTPDFNNDSPGRAAVWLGWQIVKKFMNNNPDVSIKELMEEDDYQKILTLSKYKP